MIWIDGDATPRDVKEIVYSTARRLKLDVTIVCNKYQKIPTLKWVKLVVVEKGIDKADEYIVQRACEHDVVITADIPFASEVISKKAHVLTPSGEYLDQNNITERLSMRNFFDTLRSSTQFHSQTPTFSNQQRKEFANAMDSLITRIIKKKSTDPT